MTTVIENVEHLPAHLRVTMPKVETEASHADATEEPQAIEPEETVDDDGEERLSGQKTLEQQRMDSLKARQADAAKQAKLAEVKQDAAEFESNRLNELLKTNKALMDRLEAKEAAKQADELPSDDDDDVFSELSAVLGDDVAKLLKKASAKGAAKLTEADVQKLVDAEVSKRLKAKEDDEAGRQVSKQAEHFIERIASSEHLSLLPALMDDPDFIAFTSEEDALTTTYDSINQVLSKNEIKALDKVEKVVVAFLQRDEPASKSAKRSNQPTPKQGDKPQFDPSEFARIRTSKGMEAALVYQKKFF